MRHIWTNVSFDHQRGKAQLQFFVKMKLLKSSFAWEKCTTQLRWEAKKIGFVTMMKKSESIKKADLFVDISNLLARFLSF